MATRTISNAGGNWNATGTWAEGAVPTSADDVVATSTSGNLTINAAAACRSIDLTNYVRTVTHNSSITLSIGTSTANGTVALKFPSSGWTYTLGAVGSSAISFVSTSATQLGVTTGGKTLGNVTFNGAGGSWQLLDTFTSNAITLTAGSLDTNSKTLSIGSLSSSNSNTRSLTLRSSNITILFSGFTNWNFGTTTGLTFSGASSTITVPGAGSFQTFAGGGLTYGTVVIPGPIVTNITGSNTFNILQITTSAYVNFLPGTTQTLTNLFANGSTGNLITIATNTSGSSATLSKSSGVVSCDFLKVQDSIATGGADWYAGANSSSVSGNSGWQFKSPADFLQMF